MTDEEKIKAIRARLERWVNPNQANLTSVAFALRHVLEDIAYIVGPE